MKSVKLKQLKFFLLSFVIQCTISGISAEFLTRYSNHKNKKVSSQYLPNFQIGEPFNVSEKFRESKVVCGLACNQEPTCTAFSLNNYNSCLLLNDKISLIYFVDEEKSNVYAKTKLYPCIKDHYPENAINCIQKKSFDAVCTASKQCSILRGLVCVDSNSDGILDTCKCQNSDFNYWVSAAGKCLPKLTYETGCSSSGHCLQVKGLECTGTCTCSQPNEYAWYSSEGKCDSRQTYGGSCQSSNQCLQIKGPSFG